MESGNNKWAVAVVDLLKYAINNKWAAVLVVVDLLKYAIDGPGRWWKLAVLVIVLTAVWWVVGGGGAQTLDHVLSGTSTVSIPQRPGP